MSQSEFILNPDGSVYHLNLLPGEVAPLIILVGDPDRVPMVSRYFDQVSVYKQRREFITHTGQIGSTSLSVISTGIGTDNVDIVLNEVDALFNVDFASRMPKQDLEQLTFIRIGTSGAIQEDIPVDSFLISQYALGLDALSRMEISHTDSLSHGWYHALINKCDEINVSIQPSYMSMADHALHEQFSVLGDSWITATCAGFYGLQGRSIRLKSTSLPIIQALMDFESSGKRVGNLEMETAGIYLLAHLLGHRALSLNAVIANRVTGQFSAKSAVTIDRLIQETLRILVA